MSSRNDRIDFFLKQLGKGFLFLIVIVGGYIFANRFLGIDLKTVMGPLYESPKTVFTIFLISEFVFGIIPPEFFFIWAQRHHDLGLFINNVIVLGLISYSAGVFGYWFGRLMDKSKAYHLFSERVFGKFEKHFHTYGGFLVIVAAMTPLPFSGICMLVGSVRYPFSKFLIYSTARFVRFAVYAGIIWQAQL